MSPCDRHRMCFLAELRGLTTSIHAHPVVSSPPCPSCHMTSSTTSTTDATHPHQIPNTPWLTLCPFPTVKPHMLGKNCEYITTHNTAPCAAKRKSLKRTVVSGASGCLCA